MFTSHTHTDNANPILVEIRLEHADRSGDLVANRAWAEELQWIEDWLQHRPDEIFHAYGTSEVRHAHAVIKRLAFLEGEMK